MRSLFGQTSGDKVGTVVEFADGSFHALAKLFAHVFLTVDDRGNSKDGNGSLARNVIDAR
jgi:hypothetical protein